MNRVNVTIRLPKELAEKADALGLLTDERVEVMLEEELDRLQRADRFFDTIDKLNALEPRITPEEIDAEIEAHKREKRERNQGAT